MSAREPGAGAARALGIDVFCRVVDNFGDAGVCWRLARQLALEHGAAVRLWIDRPEFVARLAAPQDAAAVAVMPWEDAERGFAPRDAVLCTFGCELPPGVRSRIPADGARPVWVNLEYLSAEPWIENCHRIASVKPADRAIEWFFYPGFTAASGGLIRENGLAGERARFLRDECAHWLAARGLDSHPGALRVSLFCYPQAPVAELLALLADGPARAAHLLLPEGVAEEPLRALLGTALAPGQSARAGALTVHRFAFLDQRAYDRLLWSCDLNFVRGEDSWVRAHWAHRPFLWQPYPQSLDTHLVKLDAFLARMLAHAPAPGQRPACAAALGDAMRGWNGATPFAPAWREFAAALPELGPLYAGWAGKLERAPDLAKQLYQFIAEKL